MNNSFMNVQSTPYKLDESEFGSPSVKRVGFAESSPKILVDKAVFEGL